MHHHAFEGVMDSIAVLIETFHQENPLRAGMEMPSLRNRAKLEQPLLEQALSRLQETGALTIQNDKIRRSSFSIKISPEENRAKKELEELFRSTRFGTPRKAELSEKVSHKKDRIEKVLNLLIDEGTVLLLKDDVFLHQETLKEGIDLISKFLHYHIVVLAWTMFIYKLREERLWMQSLKLLVREMSRLKTKRLCDEFIYLLSSQLFLAFF